MVQIQLTPALKDAWRRFQVLYPDSPLGPRSGKVWAEGVAEEPQCERCANAGQCMLTPAGMEATIKAAGADGELQAGYALARCAALRQQKK